MKRLATIAVGVFAVLGAWVAAGAPDVDPWVTNYARYRHVVPQAFEQSIQFNFADAGTVNAATVQATTLAVTSVTANGLSFAPSGRGTLIYDFPAVTTSGANSGCVDSAAGTATGCAFGDGVLLGVDQVPVNICMEPTAYVSAAGAFRVRICNHCVDAGTVDMPDASYTATCVR